MDRYLLERWLVLRILTYWKPAQWAAISCSQRPVSGLIWPLISTQSFPCWIFRMQASSSNRDGPRDEEHGSNAPSFPGTRSLAAGAAGGVCSVLVGHPFDLIKVRLQTADKDIRRSAVDVFKSSLTRERGIKVRQRLWIRSRLCLTALGHLRRRLRTLIRRDTNL